jgi:hypothetical protein
MAKAKKDIAAFRAAFDPNVIIPNKIRDGLAALSKAEGPDAWEKEVDFLRRAGINHQTIAPHRDAFKAHIVEAKDKSRPVLVWFVDAKRAAEMRKALNG